MSRESSFAKIKTGKLYQLPSGNVVRVVRVNSMRNNVIVHNYHSHANEAIEYETAPALLTPVLKIGEVAKLLGRKSATIRKYEQIGLIPKARKISLNVEGKITTRVYSPKDIEELIDFFDRRKPVGRPGKTNIGGINRKEIKRRLDSKYIRKD